MKKRTYSNSTNKITKKWNEEETALLIDGYMQIKNGANKSETIQDISNKLRRMAVNAGLEINEVYRNYSGISMQMEGIKTLFGEGSASMNHTSKVFKEMVHIYKFNNDKYKEILNRAKLLINDNKNNSSNSIFLPKDKNEFKNKYNYAEIYNLDTRGYKCVKIEDVDFSVRTAKRLTNNNINNVEELLLVNRDILMSIRGFGSKCMDEVENYITSLVEKIEKNDNESIIKKRRFIYDNFDKILEDSFIVDEKEVGRENCEILKTFKEFILLFGVKDIEDIVESKKSVVDFYNTLRCINKKLQLECIKNSGEISKKILELKAKPFINLYLDRYGEENELRELSKVEGLKIKDIKGENIDELKRFLSFCNINIVDKVNGFFNKLINQDERVFSIIKDRILGKTLNEIGNEMSITRERVRQLEKKGFEYFATWEKKHCLVRNISARRNDDKILTPMEIRTELKGSLYIDEILYLLENFYTNTIYDSDYDVFVLCDFNEKMNIINYLDKLPEIFSIEELNSSILEDVKEKGINEEFFLRIVKKRYYFTGKIVSKQKMSLGNIYSEILRRYFPNGIHIYDKKEIERFRVKAKELCNLNLDNNSDRSIVAIVLRVGILSDKGVYKAKQKEYISKKLLHEIYDYIMTNVNSMCLTNSIYKIFESKLRSEGVNNSYYLHGILKEMYSDKLFFKKEYICKDKKMDSMYDEIINYIKQQKYMVTKDEISKYFGGLSDIVINLAIDDSNIINYFGKYMHKDNFSIRENEKNYINSVLENKLSDGESHHIKEIYEFIYNDRSTVLSNNGIDCGFALFSICKYMFNDEYVFDRPYIVKIGKKISTASEKIEKYVREHDEVCISKIQEIASENYYNINSILDYVNSFNATHLLIDKDRLMRIESIGVSKEDCKNIEKRVIDEIEGTKPIAYIDCLYYLDKINVKWNEWLIYSMLNKWSINLEVAASNSQFRASTALVAKRGELDVKKFENHDPTNVFFNDDEDIEELLLNDIDELDLLECINKDEF